MGWDGGGTGWVVGGRGHMCVPMVHVAVWQKATQCCNYPPIAILKKEEKGEKLSINLKK